MVLNFGLFTCYDMEDLDLTGTLITPAAHRVMIV